MAERILGRAIGITVGSQTGGFFGNVLEDTINPMWSPTWREAHGNIDILQHPDVMAQGAAVVKLSTALYTALGYFIGRAFDRRRRR